MTGREAGRERPILFSGPMVRAILEGKKTQTRRVVKPQPVMNVSTRRGSEREYTSKDAAFELREDGWWCAIPGYAEGVGPCPYGAIGDRLWVRETWASLVFERDWETGHVEDWEPAADPRNGRIVFDADPHEWNYNGNSAAERGFPWRPSIFMPRWASRLSLEITGVRVERLRDISEADAAAEGVEPDEPDTLSQSWSADMPNYRDARAAHRATYRTLWNSLNAKRGYGWDVNPWAWVVEFRRLAAGAK